jgi:hypothetical protein
VSLPHTLENQIPGGRKSATSDRAGSTTPRTQYHRQASPGLILVPQKLALSAAIEELLLLWMAFESNEWVNQISYLPV